MTALFCALLSIEILRRIWEAANHAKHEDCPACGLWIGDPMWAGEPRVCPKCKADMLPKPPGRPAFWGGHWIHP